LLLHLIFIKNYLPPLTLIEKFKLSFNLLSNVLSYTFVFKFSSLTPYLKNTYILNASFFKIQGIARGLGFMLSTYI
jgi:hypothetical protein